MVYRRWWLVAGVLLITMGLTGVAAAQLPAVSVQTPAVSTTQLPPVPVPTSALPAPPSVPSAPVPTVPSVTLPVAVAAPAVSAPSVSTPSLSTPAGEVPSVSTPRVSATSAGAAAGSGSAPSSSAGSGRSATSGAGTTAAAGTTPGGSASPAASGSASAGTSARSHSSKGLSDPVAKVRRRERALRRAVLRFQGCLSRVPRAERRVLTLRAGVGAARTHSRTEVARITHLRRTRVVTLERRGLRRLRALGRTGDCQDAQTASAAAPVATAAAPPAGSAPGGRAAVLSEHQVSDSRPAGAQGHPKPTAELSISRPPIAPGTGGFDLTLVFAALGLLAFVFVVTREVKRTD
jgi:hypothetical protein